MDRLVPSALPGSPADDGLRLLAGPGAVLLPAADTPSLSAFSVAKTCEIASRRAVRFSLLTSLLPRTVMEIGIEMLSPIERVSPFSNGKSGSPLPAMAGKIVDVPATSA